MSPFSTLQVGMGYLLKYSFYIPPGFNVSWQYLWWIHSEEQQHHCSWTILRYCQEDTYIGTHKPLQQEKRVLKVNTPMSEVHLLHALFRILHAEQQFGNVCLTTCEYQYTNHTFSDQRSSNFDHFLCPWMSRCFKNESQDSTGSFNFGR